MAKVRVLSCEIFKSNLGDCSNGGISSKYNEVYLIHPEGNMEVEDDDPRLVELVKRELFGGEKHWYIKPYEKEKSGKWWMFGGTFIYSSDSRFSEYCETDTAMKFFDRHED